MSGSQGLRERAGGREVALSLVLLIGAGLMIKSFVRLSSVNPGFHPESALVITVNLPDQRGAERCNKWPPITTRCSRNWPALPGVTSAGAIDWLPFDDALIRGDFYSEAGFVVRRLILTSASRS